jgi:hypothetical protein
MVNFQRWWNTIYYLLLSFKFHHQMLFPSRRRLQPKDCFLLIFPFGCYLRDGKDSIWVVGTEEREDNLELCSHHPMKDQLESGKRN